MMETSNPLLNREGAFSRSWGVSQTMTLEGVVNKTGILLLLCVASGAFSWTHPALQSAMIILGLIGGLVTCLIGTFKPTTTPITAPLYAIFEGLCLGAISQVIQLRFPGLVVNAILLTFGVLGLMLMLYVTRVVRVTQGFMRAVLAATLAVALVYLVDMVLGMFHFNVPFIHEGEPIGIGVSLLIVGIAAFNLLVDFAVIESAVRGGSPRYMEWYCGMALLVTLVWLYLEILRLLSKIRGRD